MVHKSRIPYLFLLLLLFLATALVIFSTTNEISVKKERPELAQDSMYNITIITRNKDKWFPAFKDIFDSCLDPRIDQCSFATWEWESPVPPQGDIFVLERISCRNCENVVVPDEVDIADVETARLASIPVALIARETVTLPRWYTIIPQVKPDLLMTYHLDSDIPLIYKLRNNYTIPPTPIDKRRTDASTMWVASHCHDNSTGNQATARQKFVDSLMKFIPVHSYGKCLHNHDFSDENFAEILPHYKFYLALENSRCKDYVTEKFYRPLGAGTVPIVIGPQDYRPYAPDNHSYINAADFDTIQDLADYLKYLNSNNTAYLEYLDYKKKDHFEWASDFSNPCNLASRLCNSVLHNKLGEKIFPVFDTEREWRYSEGPNSWKACIPYPFQL